MWDLLILQDDRRSDAQVIRFEIIPIQTIFAYHDFLERINANNYLGKCFCVLLFIIRIRLLEIYTSISILNLFFTRSLGVDSYIFFFAAVHV